MSSREIVTDVLENSSLYGTRLFRNDDAVRGEIFAAGALKSDDEHGNRCILARNSPFAREYRGITFCSPAPLGRRLYPRIGERAASPVQGVCPPAVLWNGAHAR